MPTFASNLATLARSKLTSGHSSGPKDNLSLHRWVLLKNSLTRDSFIGPTPEPPVYEDDEEEDDPVDEAEDEEAMFSYLFPDPGDALASVEDGNVSEAQWLDSLLEKLGDDDDDEASDLGVEGSIVPLEEDERFKWDALPSPHLDSTASLAHPYPVPYPPFHPPLLRSLDIHTSFDSSCSTSPSDSTPFYEVDDPYFPMPDAIEDTSDDESESVTTPFTRSRSSLNLVDPASVPLPLERPRAMLEPHVYSNAEHSLFYPFDLDPLPYPDVEPPPVYNPFRRNCL